MDDNVFVLVLVFMTVVAPIWLAMHYIFKGRAAKKINAEGLHDLEEMLETIDKLCDRVETLEQILDAENGKWRSSRKEGRS